MSKSFKRPGPWAIKLATKLAPPKGWHLDAAAIIQRELNREIGRAKKKSREWQEYLEELDGVE